MNHVLVDVFRKDGYDMTTLYIVAVNSELAQTKYINTPVDTLLFHMNGEVSFDDRKIPTEHYVTERILQLFNTHNKKNDFIHLLQGSSTPVLERVFDITAEKQIKSVPVVTNSEEYQTSGKRDDITTPTPDLPPSRRGGTDRTIITGGITLSVGLFFLASLLLLYIFVHTRRRPEKLEDNNTVESSCDLEGSRPDIVVVEPSSPEQPICGLSVDIAPSIMKELEQISPLRSPDRNREKSNHKRMFSKSKKKRYNARRRGADLKLKLDTIEEDDSSSHSSSEYYTDTSRSEVETDDETVEQQFPYNIRKFSLERYANVATFCDEDFDNDPSMQQENTKLYNTITNMPETKGSNDKELINESTTVHDTESNSQSDSIKTSSMSENKSLGKDETRYDNPLKNECANCIDEVEPKLNSDCSEHQSNADEECLVNDNLPQSKDATVGDKNISSTEIVADNGGTEELKSSSTDKTTVSKEQQNQSDLVSGNVPNLASKDKETCYSESINQTQHLDVPQEPYIASTHDENKIGDTPSTDTYLACCTESVLDLSQTINDNQHDEGNQANDSELPSSPSKKNIDNKNEAISPELMRDTQLPLFEI